MSQYCRLLFVIASLAMSLACRGQTAPRADYLILPDPRQTNGADAEYTKLYERKLFITSGELARFVQLPGPLAKPEVVVSVQRKDSPEEYWVTLTEPSRRLADCDPIDPTLRKIDPDTIQVSRFDAPLPKRTALALHSAWLGMLERARRDPCPECSGEGTTEIFSAKQESGKLLEAYRLYPGAKTLELTKLAGLLLEYCRGPAKERDKIARDIEKQALQLRNRITEN